MKETKQANRPLEMFKRIDDSTNFSELIERDEWPEVRAMIILSVQSYDSNNKKIEALLDASKRALNCLEDQVEGQHTTKDALRRAIKLAEAQ